MYLFSNNKIFFNITLLEFNQPYHKKEKKFQYSLLRYITSR